MKTAAIIAEYNPFHNGHLYQLVQTRLRTNASFILVIMSGDFLQRGGPAFANKYLRTRMALLGGADAVIELPALYAVSSAEYFASGAVTLLNQLGVADYLSFGSELGSLSIMEKCSQILTDYEQDLRLLIKTFLKEGYSFPDARERAASQLFPSHFSDSSLSFSDRESSRLFSSLFSSPNNILGLEYCKALYATQSSIRPFTIKREDAGYHSTSLNNDSLHYVSASAIRNALSQNPDAIAGYVPEAVYRLLSENRLLTAPLTENDFSGMLYYKLLMEKEKGFSDYLDCTPDMSDKICRELPSFTTFTGFCSHLKSKDLTYARISRVLLHILLNIKTPDFFLPPASLRSLSVPYARLLGFKKSASPLLSAIKKNSAIPLITKLANAPRILDENARLLLSLDIRCADLYEWAASRRLNTSPLNEWKQSPIVLL